MKMSNRRNLLIACLVACCGSAFAATVGQPAPGFELTDTAGKVVKLADYKGKFVVLEWTNPGCPFVVKHYGSQTCRRCKRTTPRRTWFG
jgi:hypothetical protein